MRLSIPVLLSALLLSTTSFAFNLDSLLIKSVGGPEAYDKLETVRTVHSVGRVNFGGQPGSYEGYFVAPDRFRMDMKFAQFGMTQAYDGTTAWQIDLNGFTTTLEGYEKRDLLKQVYFESYSWLFPGRLPGHAEYRGEKTEGDTTYDVVAFFPFDRDSTLMYFDHSTGLNLKSYNYSDNLTIVTTNSDFREVNGVVAPFHSLAAAIDAPLTVEAWADTVVFDGPVDTSMFSPPPVKEEDYHFPETVDSVRVSFDYFNGHIYVPATVNGKEKAWFILDSGASANILQRQLADALSLPSVGTMPARGMGGFDEVNLVRVDSFTIGDLVLRDQVCGDLDMSAVASTAPSGDAFGGVLGFDFLSRFPIMVNYRDSSLIVFNPDKFTAPEGGIEVPFFATLNVPTIEATLDSIPGDFIVDLGNSSGLIIHAKFAADHDLLKKLRDVRSGGSMLGGIGGDIRGKTALAGEFEFGGIRIDSLRVILPETSGGLAGSSELAGNIGNLVLENFRVLFDYADQRLIFYPPED